MPQPSQGFPVSCVQHCSSFLSPMSTDHRTQHLVSVPRKNAHTSLTHMHNGSEDYKAGLGKGIYSPQLTEDDNSILFFSASFQSAGPICLSPPHLPHHLWQAVTQRELPSSLCLSLSLSPTHPAGHTQIPLGALPRLDMFSYPSRPLVPPSRSGGWFKYFFPNT